MKNMKAHVLTLSIFLALVATPYVCGWRLNWQLGIANYTKATVKLDIAYVWRSCKTDTVTVQPGQIIHVNAKACLVDDITGTATLNGKTVALTKGGAGTIGGRDFSINVIEIGSGDSEKTYRIERVK